MKGVIVEIWQRGLLIDSGIKFLCGRVQFYYDDRKIIMYGVKQLQTLHGKGLLIDLSMESDDLSALIATLPPSEKYTILIGGKEHILSVIK